MLDLIDRQAAIDALWKALYEYEDKAGKQFQESEDLDVGDWIEHRIFVQNMNDIGRQTILNLPSAQPDIIRCGDCKWYGRADKRRFYRGMDCLQKRIDTIVPDRDFCSKAERRTDDQTDKGASC